MLLHFLLNSSKDFSMRKAALHPGLCLRSGLSSAGAPGILPPIALADTLQVGTMRAHAVDASSFSRAPSTMSIAALAVSSWSALCITCSCPFSTDSTSVSDARMAGRRSAPQSAVAFHCAPHLGLLQ